MPERQTGTKQQWYCTVCQHNKDMKSQMVHTLFLSNHKTCQHKIGTKVIFYFIFYIHNALCSDLAKKQNMNKQVSLVQL